MNQSPNALQPAAAARLLLWLKDMGADEICLNEPVNRFLEKPPAPVAKPLPDPPPGLKPATRPFVAPSTSGAAPDFESAHSIAELAAMLESFDDHPLKRTASRHCLHAGAEMARVLVLVDRPRAEEDRSGQVLAGKHEVLAERMLAAVGLKGMAPDAPGEAVALASFLPWRPPGNRAPTDLECQMLLPLVRRLVALIRPRIILALGALPGQWLAGGTASIASQRGKWLKVDGIPMIATFHPETLLKAPASKRLTWHDLLALRAKLDEIT